jgi:hypothetical protein
MKRAVGWLVAVCLAGSVVGCAEPVAHTAALKRSTPTPVRSLLIVVDDSVFAEVDHLYGGRAFTDALAATLRDNAGSIPVTLLEVHDTNAVPLIGNKLLTSHATQVMTVRATRVTTTLRGNAPDSSSSVWHLSVADVHRTSIPDPRDPSKVGTRIEERVFYREVLDSPVSGGVLDLATGGPASTARVLAQEVNDRLRQDHVLTPDTSPAPVDSDGPSIPPTQKRLPPGTESL